MARILVIEDEKGVRDVVSTLLRLNGHEVQTAHDLPDACRILQSSPPDAIVSDLRLPSGDASELVRRQSAQRPVIVLSAIAGTASGASVARLGAFAVLPKPFSEDHLLETVEAALRSRR
ncbi:MAG: response regulator [Nitrospirae bacterium]|nr:response regulator [Nitrospirota bacterium]